MSLLNEIFVFLAALAAGFINAIAGGGTLITFPVLLAIGIPPVSANVTNTVALVPGTIGGMWGQRKDFKSQAHRLARLLPVGVAGGIVGGLLLLNTSEKSFRSLIPWLILLASSLLAAQVRIKRWVVSRSGETHREKQNLLVMISLVFFASIYGGYFGAGLGVILLAVLGLLTDDSLVQLNFLKQALAFSVNLAAAIYFAFSGKVDWMVAFVMVFGSVSGGFIGGKLAGRLNSGKLRWVVVVAGITAAIIYYLKN